MAGWLVTTLRAYPEIAIFLALAIGFLIGPIKLYGFNLGNVTGTLIAAVIIGQLGITISPNVKAAFFILFIFAVGYGVGPQFVRGLGKEGPRQIGFSLVILALCLLMSYLSARIAGLSVGYAAGLYAGSQTISASIGVATDQIGRLGLPVDQARLYVDQIPIGYAVTYIWGTIGSALILAQLGPRLIGVNLPQACKDYEQLMGGGAGGSEPGSVIAYHRVELRAYRITADSNMAGPPVTELLPGMRVFVERVRRGTQIIEADPTTTLQVGDIAAISGPRQLLVERIEAVAPEVDDPELLDMPAEVVDVFVTSKIASGKTLRELSVAPYARGVYLSKIMRNLVEIPILPETEILRGDVLTIGGARRHVETLIAQIGYADRPVETTDIAFVGAGIVIGGLIGALSYKWGGIPLSLSTSGGALLSGLVLGWLRTVHPTFGRIPGPALWLMNTLGLNIFIAVVGISAGPGFVAGLKEVGISLFIWGVVATSIPMILSVYIGHYIFKFHPAILFGACAGVRTTTAALGMIQEAAKSNIPALGYGMPYAIGNTLLTIFGMVIVLLFA
ncbi:aspartate-alanine antiporter [Limobrevibacterium gyesilva]|uniref:Aspartate-alanine antiporter n=1 Tax=Limobrevibacterium gyesilva TaxID=2991712 RepID=A0AA41YPF1_9PROT|nr:aspartate-alanine antiporter [Limobrevibacterium gyesilva]MCW3474085.1 aspartate-alanine antiporter [Limobrevibacterium gyesilva]